jgi:hypothetical protein
VSDNLDGLRSALAGPFEPVYLSGCSVTVEGRPLEVGLAAGDFVAGPEYLSPDNARAIAAALISAADYVEANR